LREVVHGTKGFITCLLVKQVPDDPPALKAEMRTAIHRAFLTVESRGEFERVIGRGWKGVVARIIELVREPAITLLLKDVPEGKAKGAVRSALLGLAAEGKPTRLLELLSKGGIPGLLGEVLTSEAVAEAIAELLLGDLADTTFNNAKLKATVAAKLKQRGGELVASPGSLPPGFLKNGLADLVSLAAEPLEAWLAAQVSSNIKNPALKAAIIAVLKKGREDIMSGGSLATVLKGAGGVILVRLKAYFAKVREKLDATAFAAVNSALQGLAETMKSVRVDGAAASSAMVNISMIVPSIISDLAQLDTAVGAAKGFQLPAEVMP
jgi:hypothetical protein